MQFRTVIARGDPGVPNWLDTGGYAEGVIQAAGMSAIQRRSPLRSVLPADTPQVSPADRERQLRERRLGAQMRHKW